MQISTVVLIIVAVLVFWFIFVYNKFVRLITRAKEAWSDIEVQMKRRYDLVPNLVNTVKGYATHESSAFENVTKARAMSIGAQTIQAKGEAENVLSGALKSLFAVAEAYPDLKANENFLHLQMELADTENKIQAARRFYNTNVRDLNISVDTFPGNMVARSFGFNKMEFFDLEDTHPAQEAVKVQF